jgi:hypothetical protein
MGNIILEIDTLVLKRHLEAQSFDQSPVYVIVEGIKEDGT